MNTINQGREAIYESAFKIAVAREYLTGALGYGSLAKKYGLPGPHTVNWFVKWYKSNYPQHSDNQDKNEKPVSKDQSDNQISNQLREANLKIAGLEMLIETAQKELGVDIVKKPGTKQL